MFGGGGGVDIDPYLQALQVFNVTHRIVCVILKSWEGLHGDKARDCMHAYMGGGGGGGGYIAENNSCDIWISFDCLHISGSSNANMSLF